MRAQLAPGLPPRHERLAPRWPEPGPTHRGRKFILATSHSTTCWAGAKWGKQLREADLQVSFLWPNGEYPTAVHDLFSDAAAKVDNKIEMDHRIYGGAPCIAGTRIPVYAILELIEAGWSRKKILSKKGYPITAAQLDAALRFASIVMER